MMLKGKKELAHTCSGKSCNTLEENTHSSTEWTCTCCHTTNSYRRQFLKYNDKKYNHNIMDINRSLRHHYTNLLNGEFICQSCDRYLLLGKMPPQAAESPTKRTTDMSNECSCCKCTFIGPSHILDNNTYLLNNTFAKIQEDNPNQSKYAVCACCFHKITQSNLMQGDTCDNIYKKINLSHMPIIQILCLLMAMNT